MDINQANLKNLTQLWRKYGVQDIALSKPLSGTVLTVNHHWPHRVWQSALISKSLNDSDHLLKCLDQIPECFISHATVPVCSFNEQTNASDLEQHLAKNNWQCAFQQTAMYLSVEQVDTQPFSKRDDFSIEKVTSLEQLSTWVSIASEAFGYAIDQTVFEKLLHDADIQILLGMLGNEGNSVAVATALLYREGSVIGLHQMGVAKGFQGQGIAKKMMHGLIEQCVVQQDEYLVLQASQAGKPLYDSLGFKGQFEIRNYRRRS